MIIDFDLSMISKLIDSLLQIDPMFGVPPIYIDATTLLVINGQIVDYR